MNLKGVQAEVVKVAGRNVCEAPAMVGEPRVILTTHAVSKLIIENMPLSDGGFPAVEAGGEADVASWCTRMPLSKRVAFMLRMNFPLPSMKSQLP
jgi:hypothetical protein